MHLTVSRDSGFWMHFLSVWQLQAILQLSGGRQLGVPQGSITLGPAQSTQIWPLTVWQVSALLHFDTGYSQLSSAGVWFGCVLTASSGTLQYSHISP